MTTDTTERGLERLICAALTGYPCDPPKTETVGEPPAGYGGVGWGCGNPYDYDREYCVDPGPSLSWPLALALAQRCHISLARRPFVPDCLGALSFLFRPGPKRRPAARANGLEAWAQRSESRACTDGLGQEAEEKARPLNASFGRGCNFIS